ncbi:UDP-N-acetylglucosamine transferase subunit ALG14 homolog isoform X2 [Folsomia candida]|nr:UDP-N-acetylglucosamine transferase subunit ALG14 homolog isoform X2 [Folsomia candida]
MGYHLAIGGFELDVGILEVIGGIFGLTVLVFWIRALTSRREVRCNLPFGTLIVLGSGGHTMEMMTIVKSLNRKLYSPRTYVIAESDTLSFQKVQEYEQGREDCHIDYVHRVREVGQDWVTTLLWSMPIALFQCHDIMKYNKPALILCNGPGICVPICLMAKLYQYLFRCKCTIVYIESVCRVTSLSFTGKILQYCVDHFVVQWREVQRRNGFLFFGRLS